MVALGSAELDVGNDLGDENFANQGPIGVVDMDAIGGAGPDPALDVEPETIEEPGTAGGEDLAPGESGIVIDGEAADVAGPSGACVAPVSET